MFNREYSFRGIHAERVISLTANFDDAKHKLFERNLDVYLLAPIVGFLYGRKADLDRGSETTKIFLGQLTSVERELWFIYRLIVLLDRNHEPDFNQRVEKAFRQYGSKDAKAEEQLYESYVRGGVDVLYEKLMTTIKTADDYLENLYAFLEEFEELYGQNEEEIFDLVKLAKG